MCAETDKGSSSQLSMLRLDPVKLASLFEGIDPSPSPRSKVTGGQGFGLSQAERRAVEIRAMQVAKELYERNGWKVIDMSLTNPFDLRAEKDGAKRFIEVKGTTGQGLSIVLTHGEVKQTRCNVESSALVIVSGIDLELRDGEWRAEGGIVSTHKDPWTLVEANLSATEYRYKVT